MAPEYRLITAIYFVKEALKDIPAKPEDLSFVMSKDLMLRVADSFKMTEVNEKCKGSILGIDIIEK